jgi:hypothetical protein
MKPLDTDYMEAMSPAPARPASVRVSTHEIFADICSGPRLGKWEATPRGDGTFGVRRVAAGLVLISGHHTTQAGAQREADRLNEIIAKGDA